MNSLTFFVDLMPNIYYVFIYIQEEVQLKGSIYKKKFKQNKSITRNIQEIEKLIFKQTRDYKIENINGSKQK